MVENECLGYKVDFVWNNQQQQKNKRNKTENCPDVNLDWVSIYFLRFFFFFHSILVGWVVNEYVLIFNQCACGVYLIDGLRLVWSK